MNIFVLDTDPRIAAEYQCDKHVVKMVLETAQLLSTARQELGCDGPYKSTHANHPCSIWVRQSDANYAWTFAHFAYLLEEYKKRYGHTHACDTHRPLLQSIPPSMSLTRLTDFAQCMPEQYRVPGDPVAAYRAYYLGEKHAFATWRLGNVPQWWVDAYQEAGGYKV